MFEQFMQMNAPAAFAILFILGAPVSIIGILVINRNVRRSQEIDYELKREQAAYAAKQIDLKRLEQVSKTTNG